MVVKMQQNGIQGLCISVFQILMSRYGLFGLMRSSYKKCFFLKINTGNTNGLALACGERELQGSGSESWPRLFQTNQSSGLVLAALGDHGGKSLWWPGMLDHSGLF